MHLPIRVVGRSQPVEVPFSLQPSFKFAVHVPGHGAQEFVAELSSRDALNARIYSLECIGYGGLVNDVEVVHSAQRAAEAILSAVLARLGLKEVGGERIAVHGRDVLTWIGVAHESEANTAKACKAALDHLASVWRDRTEPAPTVHVAADILDSYYQQAMDEVISEWEEKAQREAEEYLTGRSAGGNSEVAP